MNKCWSVSLVAALSLAAACRHENQLATIHLEWRDDSKIASRDSLLKAIATKRLALAVVDKRADKSVGHYNAKDGGTHVVTTNEDVVAFCSTVLNDRFKAIGAPFVTTGQAFTLRADLQDYTVEENDHGYHAHVAVHFALVDADGKEAWGNTLEAKTDRGGQNHTEDNWNENLSEGLHTVLQQLLTSPEFESGITGQAAAQPEVVVPLPKGPTLKLDWHGTDTARKPGVDATINAMRAITLQVKPLTDQRTEPRAIGKFDNDKSAIVYTPDNVAKFYGNVLGERLKTLGMQVSDSGAYELTSDLVELTIVEADKFHGLARVRFTLTKQGKEIWTGVLEGKSERWGKTHDCGLMNEALSNAFDDVLVGLFGSPELTAALKKK